MGTTTPNFNFYKPAIGETGYGPSVDASFDTLDAVLTPLVYNVKSPAYGATGNGTTDDTAAINAAIAAINTAGGSATLVIPAGTYKLTGNLTPIVRSHVTVRGAGWGLTVLNRTAFDVTGGSSVTGGNSTVYPTAHRGLITALGISHLEICGVTLKGTGDYNIINGVSPFAGKGVYAEDVTDLYVHDTEVSFMDNEGLQGSANCPRGRFARNYVHNIADSGLNWNSSNTTSDACFVTDNIAVDCGAGAILTTGVSVIVSRNRLLTAHPLSCDYVLVEATQDFVVSDNLIVGCDLTNAGVAAIHIMNQAGAASPNGGSGLIANNVLRNNKISGASNDTGVIMVSHGTNGTISILNNLIDTNYNTSAQAVSGVWISGATTSALVQVDRNRFKAGALGTGNQTIGIGIAASATGNNVSIGVNNAFELDVTTPYQLNVAPVGGIGITFPATQVASTNVNTLDDYEEGTWTPSVGGTATYSSQVGTYTKVGRQVTVYCELQINAIGSGLTNGVQNLPFTADKSSSGTVRWTTGAVSPVSMIVFITAGANAVQFYGATAAAASLTLQSILGNSTFVFFTITYEV